MQGAVFVCICRVCWPKNQTNKENKIKPQWKLKGGQKPQNFFIKGSTHHGLLAYFCVLYSSIHVKEIIDISWLNGQNLNTSVKVLDPRFIKVKSIISDIKWCWWHLEILLLISNWLVSHRSPTAVLSNTFQTPEAPSRLCWPQAVWSGLIYIPTLPQNVSFMDHLLLPCTETDAPFPFWRRRPAPLDFCWSSIPSSDT